uniref:Uncharacterized protein n=1 Tax=virus sp. ctPYc18 TaxID=2828251 RepID=A0A8S5RCA5_9VIRU|nr:MAG TPA: hypothetical protein [virus sp. ctPYc18]
MLPLHLLFHIIRRNLLLNKPHHLLSTIGLY